MLLMSRIYMNNSVPCSPEMRLYPMSTCRWNIWTEMANQLCRYNLGPYLTCTTYWASLWTRLRLISLKWSYASIGNMQRSSRNHGLKLSLLTRWISWFRLGSMGIQLVWTTALGMKMCWLFLSISACGGPGVYVGRDTSYWSSRRNASPVRQFLPYWDGWSGHSTMLSTVFTRRKAILASLWKGLLCKRLDSHWQDATGVSNARSCGETGPFTKRFGAFRKIHIGMERMSATYALQKASVKLGLSSTGTWTPQASRTFHLCSFWLNAYLLARFAAWLNDHY